MADFPFDIIGFDLDGTLLDTSRELAAALNHALAQAGRRTFTVEEIHPMVGGGIRLLLERALARSGDCTPELVDRHAPVLMDHYRAHLGSDSPAYPGLVAAMEAISARGAMLAVVTNKLEELAVPLLEKVGIAHHFACIIGGDTMGPGKAKPHPAPILEMIRRCGGQSAAFIGDSHADTGAARAAGIPSVAVSFGFLTGPAADLGADAVIDHYDELLETLQALRPAA